LKSGGDSKKVGVLPIRACFLAQRSLDKDVFLGSFGGLVFVSIETNSPNGALNP
jgi:hypothetical protein